MNLEYFKAIAYLISRAILLPPAEAGFALEDMPRFLKNKKLGQILDFNNNDLKYLSKLFMKQNFEKSFLDGFWGTGVGKLEDGSKCVLVYGSKNTLEFLEDGLKFAELRTHCAIRGYEIDYIRPASCSLAALNCECPGGACILPWNGATPGTLGGWLRLSNPRGVVVGITNNHVAVECNLHYRGKNIINPRANKIVGQVADYIHLTPYNSPKDFNLVDLAWIMPINSIVVDHSIGCQGQEPIGEIDFELLFDEEEESPSVFLCGTDYQSKMGKIENLGVIMFYEHNFVKYQFQDSLMVSVGEEGDSGALVCSEDMEIGGIFFAIGYNTTSGSRVGFAHIWENVKSLSGYQFIY